MENNYIYIWSKLLFTTMVSTIEYHMWLSISMGKCWNQLILGYDIISTPKLEL